MSRTRRRRLFTVLLMLGALLWAQGALAGYLCPGGAQVSETALMMQADMPCAEAMTVLQDDERTSLCHAHCQTGHTSAESYHPPLLATFAQLGAVLTLSKPTEATRLPGLPAPLQRRDGGPPLAISHCCFRI